MLLSRNVWNRFHHQKSSQRTLGVRWRVNRSSIFEIKTQKSAIALCEVFIKFKAKSPWTNCPDLRNNFDRRLYQLSPLFGLKISSNWKQDSVNSSPEFGAWIFVAGIAKSPFVGRPNLCHCLKIKRKPWQFVAKSMFFQRATARKVENFTSRQSYRYM